MTEIQVSINQGQGASNFAALPTLGRVQLFPKLPHLSKKEFLQTENTILGLFMTLFEQLRIGIHKICYFHFNIFFLAI